MNLVRRYVWIFVAAAGVFVLLLNLLSIKFHFRFDLTKDGRYTLSSASEKIVQNLQDEMTVTAYFTEQMPAPYASYARYVRDMLEEYQSASNGKFQFYFKDPIKEETKDDEDKKKNSARDIFGHIVREPTSVEKDLASLGIQPVEIQVIEDDQQQTKRAYMGISIQYKDKKEVIPVVQDINDLEKDMTNLMFKLTRDKLPSLGLVDQTYGPSLRKFRMLVSPNVTIKDIDLAAKESNLGDIDALLVVGKIGSFSPNAVDKIDAFWRLGKPVALLLDRYDVDPETFALKKQMAGQDMDNWLRKNGVSIGKNLLADVECASLNVTEQRGYMVVAMPIRYPFIAQVFDVNTHLSFMRGLAGMIVPFVSPVYVKSPEGFIANSLAKSSKKSWLEEGALNLEPKREWRSDEIQFGGPYWVMMQMIPMKSQAGKLIVVGTSAMLWEQFLTGVNQLFAVNLIDSITAEPDILAMRARPVLDPSINHQLSETTRDFVKYLNIIGVPMLLVLYGIIRWRLRAAARARYAARPMKF